MKLKSVIAALKRSTTLPVKDTSQIMPQPGEEIATAISGSMEILYLLLLIPMATMTYLYI